MIERGNGRASCVVLINGVEAAATIDWNKWSNARTLTVVLGKTEAEIGRGDAEWLFSKLKRMAGPKAGKKKLPDLHD